MERGRRLCTMAENIWSVDQVGMTSRTASSRELVCGVAVDEKGAVKNRGFLANGAEFEFEM